jgi:hypothetical protein
VWVRVEEIASQVPLTVRFSCSAGTATAAWAGERPVRGHEYDVECDVPGVVEWDAGIRPSDQYDDLVVERGGRIFLRGRLEGVDADGVLALRIAESLVLIEADGNSPAASGARVQLEVPGITLYPTHL